MDFGGCTEHDGELEDEVHEDFWVISTGWGTLHLRVIRDEEPKQLKSILDLNDVTPRLRGSPGDLRPFYSRTINVKENTRDLSWSV